MIIQMALPLLLGRLHGFTTLATVNLHATRSIKRRAVSNHVRRTTVQQYSIAFHVVSDLSLYDLLIYKIYHDSLLESQSPMRCQISPAHDCAD